MSKITIEKKFLIVSLFIGLLLCFLVPPFQSPDENTHFLKAYQISKGKFYPEQIGEDIGYYESNEIIDYIKDKESYASDRNRKYTYNEMYYDQLQSKIYDDYSFIYSVNVTPIAHLIPAIGIQISDYFHTFDGTGELSVAVKLQAARIMSLIFYSTVCYFAIKKTPRYKKSFFAILLLPNSLLLRSMVSYDGLVISLSALAIAYILDLYFNKTMFEKKHIVLFTIIGYILLNVKVVYFLLLSALLFIPVNKFRNKKHKYLLYSLIILLIIFLTIIFKIPDFFLHSTSNELVSLQNDYIMQHPFNISFIIIKNAIKQLPIQLYWLFGTYGLLDTYMPILFVKINEIIFLLILIFDSSNKKENISFPFRILYILSFFVIIYGMYLAMYSSWTPIILNTIGGNEITGVQGRYYIPIMFMIPLILGNNLLLKYKDRGFVKVINNFGIALLNNLDYIVMFNIVFSLIIILLRFYV